MNLDQVKDQLCDVGQYFFQRGWSVGTSSNYSAVLDRAPLKLLITASGKDKGRLTRDDFVIVNADGTAALAGQPKSSAETHLHLVAAQQPSVGAVLHTHSVWGTLLSDLFADEEGFEIEGYEMLKGLEGIRTHDTSVWVPIFENTQDIPTLALELADRFADQGSAPCYGYLMRRHGLYTWGKTVAEARRHIEIFEFLFECVARRLQLASAVHANGRTVSLP